MDLELATVGLDPDLVGELARELAAADAELRTAAAEVRQALSEAGVAADGPGAMEASAAWCAASAADLAARVAAVVAGPSAGGWPAGAPLPAAAQRAAQLFELLGLHGGRGLSGASPQLAERRRLARAVMAELEETKAQVAADERRCLLSPAQAERRLAELDRLIDLQRRRSHARPAEVAGLVEGLSDAEVARLASDVARALARRRLDEVDRTALASALAPLRRRLQDQIGSQAKELYTGGGGGDLAQAQELGRLVHALRLSPERERGGSPLSAFANGLIKGDVERRHFRSGWLETFRVLGQTVSGVVAVGDVRDAAASAWHRDWDGLLLNGFALVPAAGDAAKAAKGIDAIGDAAKGAEQAAEAARAAQAAAEAVGRVARRVPLGDADLERRVDDAIERALQGKVRFPRHDGKVFKNKLGGLPAHPEGYYREWTAADPMSKRGGDRVIVGGDPRTPGVVYYWDHEHGYVRIYP